MRKLFAFLVTLNLTLSTTAQQEKILFSDAISLHLKSYNQSCNTAIENRDFERFDYLFDSLVKHHLNGTFIEKLSLRKLKGGFFETEKAKKPYIIATTSTWIIKNQEEIEAINTLAEEFNGKIDIVMLFWDSKKKVRQIAKQYHKNVILTYVDEASNLNNSVINTYKHALGFPTVYYVATTNKITNINRGGIVKFKRNRDETLYASNYNFYHKSVLKLLLNDSVLNETILSDTD